MGVEALRKKTEQNRQMANDAKVLANNATLLASSLEQVSTRAVLLLLILEECLSLPQCMKGRVNVVHSTTIILPCMK